VIVLRDAFTDFACRDPDHGIRRRIVIRTAAKDVYPQGPFLEIAGSSLQRTFDDVAQQVWISPAVAKSRTLQDALELLADSALILTAGTF
jgi:hypothetical protein